MSKPIAYAATALNDKLFERGIIITGIDDIAAFTVRTFLEDAKNEGRFNRKAIDELLADLK